MKRFESHFWYDKGQRNGILFLCLFLTVIQAILWAIDNRVPREEDPDTTKSLLVLQSKRDSLKQSLITNSIEESRAFNPNYLNEFTAYQLGLSEEEMKRLGAFRKEGGHLLTAEQFRQVAGISDSLFSLLSPILTFPSTSRQRSNSSHSPVNSSEPQKKGDLNLVTVDELQGINGVGKVLSKRIVAYRKLLGGYSFEDQLYEVYNLPKSTVLKILSMYQVVNKPRIERLNVNTAGFSDLLQVPYVDYELTKKILEFRQEKGPFIKLEELKKIDSFPLEKFDRIALYLLAE